VDSTNCGTVQTHGSDAFHNLSTGMFSHFKTCLRNSFPGIDRDWICAQSFPPGSSNVLSSEYASSRIIIRVHGGRQCHGWLKRVEHQLSAVN
jgi:hypothetical protein